MLDQRERWLSIAFLLFLALALLAPAMPGWERGAVQFADQRHFHGLPNALDMLSNLPFAFLGAWGLCRTCNFNGPRGVYASAQLFFWGLLATSLGSSFYHLHPDAIRLGADRAGMSIAFAGMVGLAVGNRISVRAAWPASLFVLSCGLLAVGVYHQTGNVLPWGVVQFGGMLLVLALASLQTVDGEPRLPLAFVIAFYALAKIFELGDEAIFHGLCDVVSGHSLKHVAASFAALPVLWFLRQQTKPTRLSVSR